MGFHQRFDVLRAVKLNSEAEDRHFRAGQWFKAALLREPHADAFCGRTKGLEIITKAASEGVNTAGGFLVPTEIEDTIIANRGVAGVFRREARESRMASDLRNAPRRTTGITASFTAEASTLTDSSMGWDNVGLDAKKLYAFAKISSELDEDAVTLGQYLTEEIGFAFANQEDSCGFNADGTSTYGGMSGITKLLIDAAHTAGKVTAASGHDLFTEIDASDLGATVAALPEQYLPNAKWFCSSYACGNTFVRLGATAVGTVDTPNGPRPLFQWGGYPIVPTPKLPGSGSQTGNVMIAFGDMQRSTILGSRRGVTVRISEHVYLNTDQLAVMGTERFDLVNHNLGDTTNAGAMVGLVGN